jgi:hypothetical protein
MAQDLETNASDINPLSHRQRQALELDDVLGEEC